MPAIEIPILKKMHHNKLKLWGKDKCRKCEIAFKLNARLIKILTSNGTKYYHFDCYTKMLH